MGEVPVFVFHEVRPERLEAQLHFLRSNGYRTLDAEELEASIHGNMEKGRHVVLTFDDATWTFWAYAFPLLKKYGFRAILFAIPGIVPEDSTPYANFEDVWRNECPLGEIESRAEIQPLCTWRELAIMHESKIADIQSHSLTHARVAVSPRVVDFLHPDFETGFYREMIPISSEDDALYPERKLRLGAPVFEFSPRMSCRPRFMEAPELAKTTTAYVDNHGGSAFFGRPKWRKELTTLLGGWSAERMGDFETPEEMLSAVRRELTESKKLLEDNLVGNHVRHFCYPWFVGSDMADNLASEAGYRTVHYGLSINCRKPQTSGAPLRVRRISEEFLFRLPGTGRWPIWSISSIWMNRARRLVKRKETTA